MKRLLSFTLSATTSPLPQLSSRVKEAEYFCCLKQTLTPYSKGLCPVQVPSWLLLLGSRMDPTSGRKEMMADLFKQVNQAQVAVAGALCCPEHALPQPLCCPLWVSPSFPPATTFKPPCPSSLVTAPPRFHLPEAKHVHNPTSTHSPALPWGRGTLPQPIRQEKDRKGRTGRNRDR